MGVGFEAAREHETHGFDFVGGNVATKLFAKSGFGGIPNVGFEWVEFVAIDVFYEIDLFTIGFWWRRSKYSGPVELSAKWAIFFITMPASSSSASL